MKKNRNTIIFLSILLVLILSSIGLDYYKNQITELNNIVYPSNGEGFSIFDGTKIKGTSDSDINTNINLDLSPGREFNGVIAVKNHQSNDRQFLVESSPFLAKEKDSEIEDKYLPKLIFNNKKLIIKGDDIAYIDYKIDVPENCKLGQYTSSLRAMVIDESAEVLDTENGVNVKLAVGSRINLTVSETNKNVQYEKRSDLIYKYAKIRFTIAIRWIIGIALLLATMYFFTKAFRKK